MNPRFNEIRAIELACKTPTAQSFDEFLEEYMHNYSGSDYICWMADIYRYFHDPGAVEDKENEALLEEYGSEDEMISEYKRMADICYEEAMYNFIHS